MHGHMNVKSKSRENSLCLYSITGGHFPVYKRILAYLRGATEPSGPGPPHYQGFSITLSHTTLGRTPLDQ
jgi:hypothetical protein